MRISPFVPLCVAGIGLFALPLTARANDYPGSAITLTNTGGSPRSLFSVSDDGRTLSITGSLSSLTSWNIASGGVSGQLVGIGRVYLVSVDAQGNTSPAAGSAYQSGFVRQTATTGSTANWFAFTDNNNPRYFGATDTANNNAIFSNNAPFLSVASPALAGKSPNTTYTYGEFRFDPSLLDAGGNMKYAIGIDYIVAKTGNETTGQTARGYITNSNDLTITSRSRIPEPGALALAFCGLLPLVGVVARRR
jgi:hypothetical protein